MPFIKGQSGNPAGRKKGAKDKLPQDIKNRVLAVIEELDNEPGKSLSDCAKEKPFWFWETFGKALLPKDIKVDADVRFGNLTEEQINNRIAKLLGKTGIIEAWGKAQSDPGQKESD